MIHKFFSTIIALILSVSAFAQKAEGTTKSLVNAEKDFAQALAKDGARKAFSRFSSDDALLFRPNPVNAKMYYTSANDTKSLIWQPAYAKISRSGDWGFTTGAYAHNGTEKSYGAYLSIWKVVNGNWKMEMDMVMSHSKPLHPVTENFVEPVGAYKPKLVTEKDAAMGREIILNTERTLNSTLKSYGVVAMAGFLNPDARLLFPGNEPILGKDNIIAFNHGMIDKMILKTTAADKAISGELAYTYGVAAVDYKKIDLRESFNYMFIWERQADHNWNIIAQIFTPAER